MLAAVDSTTVALIIAAVFTSPVLLSVLNNRQQRKTKAEDYKRQDRLDLERKDNDALLAKRAKEVADTAAGAAQLLLEAQRATIVGTDEVARLAGKDSAPSPSRSPTADRSPRKLTCVTVSYPNGNRQDVLLADVPREGDHLRLNNGPTSPSLIVEHVLWIEGRPGTEPTVIIVVEPPIEKEEP